MIFYDLIHGYQPFDPDVKIPGWVERNLQNVYIPSSLQMKHGLIPRAVQIQAWTINSWLKSKQTKSLAEQVLQNLRIGLEKKNIEVGCSAYSHPILPMLSNDLIKAQILLDKEIIENTIGSPTWFWPPEGAIDQRVLKIIHQVFPHLIILIPDKALNELNYTGPIKIDFNGSYQNALVFSTLFKNLFMNAENINGRNKYVRRPKHLPKELVFSKVRKTAHNAQIFLQVIDFLNQYNTGLKNQMILMRDWENAGSRKALINGEINVFSQLKHKLSFSLISQINWDKARVVPISQILPSSWEVASSSIDPFPWWQPSEHGKIWQQRTELKKTKVIEWQDLIKKFDIIFQNKIKQYGDIYNALKHQGFKNTCVQALPGVHSCVGWHYLAKRSWGNYQYAQQTIKDMVIPCINKIELD